MYERVEEPPPRPALPMALWALAAVCLTEKLVMAWGFYLTQRALLVVLGFCVTESLVAGLASVILSRRRSLSPQLPLVLALSCCLAGAAASLVCLRQHGATEALESRAVSGWELRVISDAHVGSSGYRSQARASAPGVPPTSVWLTSQEPLARGTTIGCVGRFKASSDDDYGRASWSQGVCGSVLVIRLLDVSEARGVAGAALGVRREVLSVLEPSASEGRALVAGCVCGNREALEADGLSDAFSACGMAHLVAVSGAHLGMVAALLSQLFDALGLRLCVRLPLMLLVTGAFVLFCGAPVSALRAWGMSLLAFGAQASERRSHGLSAVSVVALAMALFDPTLVGQLGFVLSVSSVVGLYLFGAYTGYLLGVLMPCPRLPRSLSSSAKKRVGSLYDASRKALAATLVCQLVTLPVVAAAFGRLSLVAPLTNLLAGPAITLLITLGLLACLAVPMRPLCDVLLLACEVVGTPLCAAVRLVARMPFASVSTAPMPTAPGPVIAVVLAIWLAWWPRVSRAGLGRVVAAGCICLMALVGLWRYRAPARVVVLDIGQGDAILVQDGRSAVLVDTGPDEAVVDALARNHVLHLDAIVLTHLHDDHYGGLPELVGSVSCERVLVARGVAAAMPEELVQACRDLTGTPPAELGYGDTLEVGDYRLRMVWPHQAVDGDENSESMELALSYADQGRELSALLTGDGEHDELAGCLAAHDVGDIDLLKVGHHGSDVSLDLAQAEALDPEVAVASAGQNNSYDHPSAACIDVLEQAGALFLCTKDVGDVDVRPGVSGPRVIARTSLLDDLS